jgi:hypothetical protein
MGGHTIFSWEGNSTEELDLPSTSDDCHMGRRSTWQSNYSPALSVASNPSPDAWVDEECITGIESRDILMSGIEHDLDSWLRHWTNPNVGQWYSIRLTCWWRWHIPGEWKVSKGVIEDVSSLTYSPETHHICRLQFNGSFWFLTFCFESTKTALALLPLASHLICKYNIRRTFFSFNSLV